MFPDTYSSATELEQLPIDDALAIGFRLLCRYRRDLQADRDAFRAWLAEHSRLPLASALQAMLLVGQVDALADETGDLDTITTTQALDFLELSIDDVEDENAAFALLRVAPLPPAKGQARA